MKNWVVILVICCCGLLSFGQTVTTSPAIPSASQPVTITFDVTGTAFASKNLSDVWLWAWLHNTSSDINAPTNVNPATTAQDAARVTRSSSNPNVYFITLTPTTFFGKPASEIQNVGVLLKGRDWSNGQTADKFITFSENFSIAFAQPTKSFFFVNQNEPISITINSNQAATINLKINGNVIASSGGEVTSFTYTHVVSQTSGSITVVADAIKGAETKTISFSYMVRTPTVSASRPAGIIDGINYSTDLSQVTLSLWAPGKSSVYLLGEFNDWKISAEYQMKKDGEHFWITITGLTTNTEYAFQYLVDESIKIADPYADKILDPDDKYIPTETYPGLKTFPEKALSDQWYFNRVSVLQTGQQKFSWVVSNFQKPAKEQLVIYELLIRDFFQNGKRNYQTLIDTVGYFKRLGINAIELMPIMEFNGNESWGYNPTFMFAADKYYGTKNKFKEFIDKCHQNGIAVILDIAMNHQDIPNAYAMLDFDFVNFKPEADNKWFNVSPTHPFNVFYDLNHESSYTKKYLDTINYYWLNEYKVDGFRFDLSKGFTQKSNPNDVNAWSAYDDSRIAILKRMADKIWQHTPNAYVILEHFASNTEEKELAEYRAAEGKGMMLWGKMTDQYNQNTMGFPSNSDISGVSSASRGWSAQRLVGFMESHDEERLMYKNILFGNSGTNYSVRDSVNALTRMRAAATMFYTIPGPKMLWEFGELGYGLSINLCSDGTIKDDCRISPKPTGWKYKDSSHRVWLFNHISDLIKLRTKIPALSTGAATMTSGNSLVKQVTIKNNPYTSVPTQREQANVVAVANFDVTPQSVTVTFPHDGNWFDYFNGGAAINVTSSSASLVLAPGDNKLYIDYQLASQVVTDIETEIENSIFIYPNPVSAKLIVTYPATQILNVRFLNTQGIEVVGNRVDDNTWDVSEFKNGLYIVEVKTRTETVRSKIFKK
jgi:1,4-alpha-glucan branching enzyme